jgi:hypothetical protein
MALLKRHEKKAVKTTVKKEEVGEINKDDK